MRAGKITAQSIRRTKLIWFHSSAPPARSHARRTIPGLLGASSGREQIDRHQIAPEAVVITAFCGPQGSCRIGSARDRGILPQQREIASQMEAQFRARRLL
jgi:hypothetical protein